MAPALLLTAALAAPAAPMTLDVGPHNSTFSGNVRGYWFTAPIDFWIHGVFVPTDASTAAQSVEIVLFNSAVPAWSSTTNDFDSLFRAVGVAGTSPIPTSIFVEAGDIIGVLGWRGTSNSYGTSPYASSILGQPVTLTRLGMQANLNTTAAQNLFTESGGSISRVELIYDSAAPSVPEPSTLTLLGLGALLLYPARKRFNRRGA